MGHAQDIQQPFTSPQAWCILGELLFQLNKAHIVLHEKVKNWRLVLLKGSNLYGLAIELQAET